MSNRFIEVSVLVYSSYEANILDKNPHELECIGCIRKLNPDRIESYCEAIPLNYFHEDNKCWTTVVMESGDEFIVSLPMSEFEKILNGRHLKHADTESK